VSDRVPLADGDWLLVCTRQTELTRGKPHTGWQLAVGSWQLAVGSWLLAVGVHSVKAECKGTLEEERLYSNTQLSSGKTPIANSQRDGISNNDCPSTP